jgi:hypothetical protein
LGHNKDLFPNIEVAHGEKGIWSFRWQRWRLELRTFMMREKEVEPLTPKMGKAERCSPVEEGLAQAIVL